MRAIKRIGLLIDLLILAASLSRQFQPIGYTVIVLVLAMLALTVVVGAVTLVLGLIGNRKPAFPMRGDRP